MGPPVSGLLALFFVSFLSVFVASGSEEVDIRAEVVPVVIDNKVRPASSKDFLTDPRVFNAEFYRKFYPQLKLSDDDAARRATRARRVLSETTDRAHGDQ